MFQDTFYLQLENVSGLLVPPLPCMPESVCNFCLLFYIVMGKLVGRLGEELNEMSGVLGQNLF